MTSKKLPNHFRALQSYSAFAIPIFTGLFLSACLQNGAGDPSDRVPAEPEHPSTEVHEVPDPIAQGWLQVVMIANSAKTTLDTMAHFNTNRNACGKDAYGAIQSNDLWHQLVEWVNESVKRAPRSEERCTPLSQELDANGYYKKSMDGTVEVKLTDGTKRQLFEVRGSEICTTIDTPETASHLLDALNQLVLIADKEDCPNGWGSALENHHGR